MIHILIIVAVLLGLAALMYGAQRAATWLTTAHVITKTNAAGYKYPAPLLNFCTACLCFWLTLVVLLIAGGAAMGATAQTALSAVTFAFINFFFIKTKLEIYE